MRASGTFSVLSFTATEVVPEPAIAAGVPVGVARMEKRFEGAVSGRAATLFTSAFDQEREVGTYVAMESFEGTLNGVAGAFCFTHSATTTGADRLSPFFVIVPGSGTADLDGITGSGGIVIDPDGTHRIWFDYELG
ncbi:DUF3224 domain-containing protein [Nocardia cyriacigeorgica]|uniref:DUF3224 domain-containing protein n=1 Tax=Nocardia cyriacigeorgica TaxID=135487 RepID=UPI002455A244|nr:DUF3224 domain-containing protein [Nocardia cyriacigeorgica]